MTEKRTVLFVDDERDVLNSLKRLFHSEPYPTLFAQGGREALDLLERKRVDVIMTDLAMPQMDGLTLLKQVQKKYPDVIRLILSVNADKDSVLNAIKIGRVSRFIVKPWNNEEIKTIVRHAVETARLQEEKRDLLKRTDLYTKKRLATVFSNKTKR